MKRILLTKDHVAKVDDDVYDWLSWYSWHTHVNRSNSCAYAARNLRKVVNIGYSGKIWMHRMIAGVPKQFPVRFRNGDTLDNCRANLQILVPGGGELPWGGSRRESQFTGVYWDANLGLWVAKINGLYIGQYDNEIEAALKYNARARSFTETRGDLNDLAFVEVAC